MDLDEEFARSLVMQDEQNQNQNQYQPRAQQQQGIPTADQLPYQARVRRARPVPDQYQSQPHGSSWDRQGGDNPNGMLAVEDKINKFAESKFIPSENHQITIKGGKPMTAAGQTFNSFLGRAKAKYSEFQQNQQQRQAENAHINARESNWGNEPQTQSHFGQQQNQWSGSAPGGGRGGAGQGMWERYIPPL